MKTSKELKNIFEAIDKWKAKHKDNVDFICSFMAFKGEESDIVEDRILAFGLKGSLKIILKGLKESLQEDKEDFIDWRS